MVKDFETRNASGFAAFSRFRSAFGFGSFFLRDFLGRSLLRGGFLSRGFLGGRGLFVRGFLRGRLLLGDAAEFSLLLLPPDVILAELALDDLVGLLSHGWCRGV